MAENIDERRDEPDDGKIAEEAMKNPKTPLNKILASPFTPMVGLALLAAGAAGKEWLDNHDIDLSSGTISTVDAGDSDAEIELKMIRKNVLRGVNMNSCIQSISPSDVCAEKIGQSFDEQSQSCSNLIQQSDVLECCKAFSEMVRQCVDMRGW